MSDPIDTVVGSDHRASSSSSLGSEDPLDRDWLSESLDRIAAAHIYKPDGGRDATDHGITTQTPLLD